MNPSIRRWIERVCKKYGLSSFYLPQRDTYLIHFKGRALQGFSGKVFPQIPRDARERQFVPLMKQGLANNIDLNNRDNLYTKKRLGKCIVA